MDMIPMFQAKEEELQAKHSPCDREPVETHSAVNTYTHNFS